MTSPDFPWTGWSRIDARKIMAASRSQGPGGERGAGGGVRTGRSLPLGRSEGEKPPPVPEPAPGRARALALRGTHLEGATLTVVHTVSNAPPEAGKTIVTWRDSFHTSVRTGVHAGQVISGRA